MSGRHSRIAALLIGALFSAGLNSTPARSANWLEKNFWMSGPLYTAQLPACDHALTLTEIRHRFDSRERQFWHSDLQLVAFEGIHETAFRPWANNTIPRRFCTAKVKASDGVWRPVHYVIGEDLGLIGASWGVEWCVVGLDRNWSNNPACKMAQP